VEEDAITVITNKVMRAAKVVVATVAVIVESRLCEIRLDIFLH